MDEKETGRLLKETCSGIRRADARAMDLAWRRWDSLCKPLRGLGALEEMVVRIAGMRGTTDPDCEGRTIVVFGADNGVTARGISQCGSEVTWQVLENIGQGKSTVCVMARRARARVLPVNIGMERDACHPAVKNVPVRRGTGDISAGPAMTREECIRAVETGIRTAFACAREGDALLAAGEMGIGNTTTSAAIASVLAGCDPSAVTGRGAGLSSEALERKISVVRKAIIVNDAAAKAEDAIGLCACVGGLDIAGMTGLYLGGAARRLPVMIDGIISGIAACLAVMLAPACRDYMIATHKSAEPASDLVFERLKLTPLLCAGMHLGEGTGAAAALPLLDEALDVYRSLPEFSEGNVKPYRHLR